jgi:hypothetical protein
MDGGMDDPCWTSAMIGADFCVLGSGGRQRAFRQTTVRACWDENALYLHILCLEPEPDKVTATIRDRDGDVWMEDAVEIFLQAKPPNGPVYQFVVNALGTYYDAMDNDPTFDCKAQIAARREAKSWSVEMALPWKELKLSPPRSG